MRVNRDKTKRIERDPWLAFVFFVSLGVALILAVLNVRNSPLVVVCLGWAIYGVAVIRRSKRLRCAALVVFSLCLPVTFLPFDVCVASGASFSVRMVPVVYTQAHAWDLERSGKRVDEDFVLYRHYPLFNRAQSALLLVLP